MMPYSCDPLSRDLDDKSITTEFMFPHLRYFEFMCAKRLRGRLHFVIRLSKIKIKVAHANFFIYLYRFFNRFYRMELYDQTRELQNQQNNPLPEIANLTISSSVPNVINRPIDSSNDNQSEQNAESTVTSMLTAAKRKMIQNQLIILIHAARCQKAANNQEEQVSSLYFHSRQITI